MGTTTAISIDRFRRTRRSVAPAADSIGAAPAAHPLVGTTLGTLERRYGLMSSQDAVVVSEVIATSGDLAVADRLAFVAAMQRHASIAVIEFDGWFVACATERTITADEVPHLRAPEGAPRLMSIASERGITPALGPLVA